MVSPRRLASGARYVTSVCTGSFVLGAAGLLKGKRATSHWAWRDSLSAFGATPDPARVVRDGNVITGGGVTAGIDMALTVMAEIAGDDYAQSVQLGIEYAQPRRSIRGDPSWRRRTSLTRRKRATTVRSWVAMRPSSGPRSASAEERVGVGLAGLTNARWPRATIGIPNDTLRIISTMAAVGGAAHGRWEGECRKAAYPEAKTRRRPASLAPQRQPLAYRARTQISPRTYPGSCSQREPKSPKGDDVRIAHFCGTLSVALFPRRNP